MSRLGLVATSIAAVIAIVVVAALATYIWTVRGIEQPEYASVLKDGAYEVRDYPELLVAEVSRTGTRYDAVRKGFRPLASYTFAKERTGAAISMTAPVTQTPKGDANDWMVRFIMPSKYTAETLPKPEGTDVRIVLMPAKRRAAIQFSGVATDDLIAAKEADLRNWMERQGLSATGSKTYAYYNDPLTPGFLRRNEVMLDVAAN